MSEFRQVSPQTNRENRQSFLPLCTLFRSVRPAPQIVYQSSRIAANLKSREIRQ
jgi:hypothetical protein